MLTNVFSAVDRVRKRIRLQRPRMPLAPESVHQRVDLLHVGMPVIGIRQQVDQFAKRGLKRWDRHIAARKRVRFCQSPSLTIGILSRRNSGNGESGMSGLLIITRNPMRF